MKKRVIGLVAASAFAVATMGGSAGAAELDPKKLGAECPVDQFIIVGFQNVQVPKDATGGTYSVTFTSSRGSVAGTAGPIVDNGKTVRRFGPLGVADDGVSWALTGASTNLPGKLILTSLECRPIEE